ncbi:MAG TPA: ABC transporter ATP-binding protein [Eubacteriales bacterium]|nr:ABC transporter ATP-binding protein [Eubacteriales bacterium]
MKEIFKYIKPYGKKLIFVAFLNVVSTLCGLFLPYVMSDMVNNGIALSDMSRIYIMGVVMLALAGIALASGIVTMRMNASISTCYTNDIQKAVFRKVNSLSFEEFGKVGTSSLLTRSTQDVFMLQEAASGVVYAVVTVPIFFVGGCILAFMSDWVLALVLCFLAPLVLFIVWLATRNMGKLWELSDKYIDIQNMIVRERLSGIRVIRAFDKEQHEHERIAKATNVMADNIIKANVRGNTINPLSLFFLNISTVVMVYVGFTRIQSGAFITAGDIIATIQYVAIIMNALLVLSWTIVFIPHIMVCVRRISEVLRMQGIPKEEFSKESLSGELHLRNVTLRYEGAEAAAVSNVDLDVERGETVAIIGGTGSGKTSLIRLIMRFFTPVEGEIYLDGKPYSELTRETIRDNIAVALQKSMIFEGTIAYNIRMGNPSASDEQMYTAARTAQIADFIDTLDDGYEHLLTQAGSNLSGGQKQRVNIARTILKPASIYIFDDSFSALDYLTESKLRRELNAQLAGKTQIIITQRAATAMRCDKVYVMDRGQIVGCGTHERLLKECRIYKEIYDSQLGGDLND